jgi:hypothetical protein
MFQETIVNDFTEQMFKKVDPNRLYLWDWMPTVGKSGGLLSGLKLDRFDVGSRVQGDFTLQHTLWDKNLEQKWNIVNVYGLA